MQWHAAIFAIKCNSVISSYYQPNVVIYMCNEVYENLELIAIAIKVKSFFHITKIGASRLPARGENLKGMVVHGYEGCDALATWISQGLIMGPFKESEVPVHKLRISPLNVEIKPNSRKF